MWGEIPLLFFLHFYFGVQEVTAFGTHTHTHTHTLDVAVAPPGCCNISYTFEKKMALKKAIQGTSPYC